MENIQKKFREIDSFHLALNIFSRSVIVRASCESTNSTLSSHQKQIERRLKMQYRSSEDAQFNKSAVNIEFEFPVNFILEHT